MIQTFAKILKPFLTILFVMSLVSMSAQNYNTTSKKAIKNFDKARQSFMEKDYDNCLSLIDKSISHDSLFSDAILLKAELLLEMKNDSGAIEAYEFLFRVDSMAYPRSAISLSKLYMDNFMYEKSIYVLEWFLSLKNQKEQTREYAENYLHLAKFRKNLFDNPVEYNPKNLGDVVNSSADEYVNQYYVNEQKLIFTKRYKSESKDDIYLKENIFVTTILDTLYSIPKFLFEDNVEFYDIGAANISADGKTVYFSASNREDALGSCDIYYSELQDGRWSEAVNIRSINTADWESQPCVSHDGSELYFVRRDKRKGTSDIFVSKKTDDGSWGKPSRLNSKINTDGNEMAPFIHQDGKTLYFSSDGHYGMGGYDLFVTRRELDGDWSEPENLGYPLNRSGDEINLIVSNKAAKAFISANRTDGFGGYDIYEFELDDRFRPESVEIEIPSDDEYYADALEKGVTVSLKNIHFEFDSYELTSNSEEGINAVFDFLSSYPEVIVLLEGHTDDMGKEDYNMILSERRAESVRKALINKGISPERIKTKGCGSSQPLLPNNFDDELRALNRRVSMTFVKDN